MGRMNCPLSRLGRGRQRAKRTTGEVHPRIRMSLVLRPAANLIRPLRGHLLLNQEKGRSFSFSQGGLYGTAADRNIQSTTEAEGTHAKRNAPGAI